MRKTRNLAIVLAAAVAICFALVSLLQSAPPEWAKQGAKDPIWEITESTWVDHAPNPRFAVYDPDLDSTGDPSTWEDDVVLDKETGLVWERSISNPPTYSWESAHSTCRVKHKANRAGWRLPAAEELQSLWDGTSTAPALPSGHPFNISGDSGEGPWYSFWTSTSKADGMHAYVVTFTGLPFTITREPKVDLMGRWCVRGGIGLDEL